MYTAEAIKYQNKDIVGWVGWIKWWEEGKPVLQTSCGIVHPTAEEAIQDANHVVSQIVEAEKMTGGWSPSRSI